MSSLLAPKLAPRIPLSCSSQLTRAMSSNPAKPRVVILGTGWGGFNLAKELVRPTKFSSKVKSFFGASPPATAIDPSQLTVRSTFTFRM